MATRSVQAQNAVSLAGQVFSLEEPWRSRFLDLIVDRVTLAGPAVAPPDRATVASWLEDRRLYMHVSQLMRTWTSFKS